MRELTRRMAYRIRGLDPWTEQERRRIEIDRLARLCRHEMAARPEGRIRSAAEVAMARMWLRSQRGQGATSSVRCADSFPSRGSLREAGTWTGLIEA